LAIKLARSFGLRVSELAKLRYMHIVLNNGIPKYFDRPHFIVDRSPYGAYLIIEKSKGGRQIGRFVAYLHIYSLWCWGSSFNHEGLRD